MSALPAHVPSGKPAPNLFHPGSTVSKETLHAIEGKYGYGKHGSATFAVYGREEADRDIYAKRFDRYYKSGRIGLKFDQIPADLDAYPQLAKAAFDAGGNGCETSNGQKLCRYGSKGVYWENNRDERSARRGIEPP